MADKEVAKVYAGALLDIGVENNILPRIEEELGFLAELIQQDKELMLYLNAPVISKDKKKELIGKLFSDKFCPEMVNFLSVLIDNDRQSLAPEINKNLIDLIDQKNNRQKVKIITSVKLEADVLKGIVNSISNKLKKEVVIEEFIDESILGGIVIRIGDTLIDGSIAKDLNIMRAKLIERKV
ncbi:MAG: ATP synthase F1 subunit delta, partial [Spirochaetes bacterium]|nr:ATP synthase F1 subunit delta [Spirochaetota bacterium]